MNGHGSDLHHLPGQIVLLVRLNEGNVVFGVKGQLRYIGEDLDRAHITPDHQGVGVGGLIAVYL